MRSSWEGERKDGTKDANDADELSLRACPVLGKALSIRLSHLTSTTVISSSSSLEL